MVDFHSQYNHGEWPSRYPCVQDMYCGIGILKVYQIFDIGFRENASGAVW